jgi:hypothetical protein
MTRSAWNMVGRRFNGNWYMTTALGSDIEGRTTGLSRIIEISKRHQAAIMDDKC